MNHQNKNKLCQHLKLLNKETIKEVILRDINPYCRYHSHCPFFYMCLFCASSLCLPSQTQNCIQTHHLEIQSHVFYLQAQSGSIWCAICRDTIQNQIFSYDGDQNNDALLKIKRFQAYIKDIWNQIKYKFNLKSTHIAHKGLKNLGNTCYLNSVLQCLYASEPLQHLYSLYQIKQQHLSFHKKIIPKEWQYFFDDMIQKRQEQIWNIVAPKKQKGSHHNHNKERLFYMNAIKKPSLNIQIKYFLEEMKKSITSESTFVPSAIIKILGSYNSKYLIQQEQDADELLLFIIDVLNQGQRLCFLKDKERYDKIESMLGNYKLSPIQHIFGFYLINQIQCNQCKAITLSLNLTYNIPLSLHTNQNAVQTSKIIHSLSKMPLQYIEELSYPQAPLTNPLLSQFFNIERLNKSNNYYQCQKCRSLVAYRKYYMVSEPEILIISLKRFNSALQKKMVYRQFPKEMNLDGILMNDKKCDYQLFAMIIHEGSSIQTGHYTSIVKLQDKWVHCSDEKVQMVSWQYVKTRQAYILLYKKIKEST